MTDSKSPPPHDTMHLSTSEAGISKKKEVEKIGINADYIAAFVDHFYTHIQKDTLLGPIFAARVTDWPVHLDRMKRFWRSVLHNSGEFSGNPMAKHIAIPGLEAKHFSHWLALFRQTLHELETHPEATEHVSARAKAIADKLLGGIQGKKQGLNIISGSRIGEH